LRVLGLSSIIKKKLADVAKQREVELNERLKIRAEEEEKAKDIRFKAKVAQIREQERLRAREGGLVKRTAKKGLKLLGEEISKNI